MTEASSGWIELDEAGTPWNDAVSDTDEDTAARVAASTTVSKKKPIRDALT